MLRSCCKEAGAIALTCQLASVSPLCHLRTLGRGGLVPISAAPAGRLLSAARCDFQLRPVGRRWTDHRSYANRPAGRASSLSPGTGLPNSNPPSEAWRREMGQLFFGRPGLSCPSSQGKRNEQPWTVFWSPVLFPLCQGFPE